LDVKKRFTEEQTIGWINVSDAKRLRGLEAENARLKKLLAESMLENEVIKDALRKSGDRAGATIAGSAACGRHRR
jgi:putative transposase